MRSLLKEDLVLGLRYRATRLAPGLIFLALIAITTAPAAAQNALGEPSSIDPVAAAIAADHPTKCDDIGWGVLLEHFDGETLAVPFEDYGTCHYGVGAVFFGGCIDPFEYGDLSTGGPPPGKTQVICMVSVMATEDFGTLVDPVDFYLLDNQDRSYVNTPPSNASMALPQTELRQMELAGGVVTFTVDAPLSSPFLLVWQPSQPPDQRLAAIIVDRTVPWGEAPQFLRCYDACSP
jgi:hypothetical protein